MGQIATKPDKVNIWSCELKKADVAGKWTNLADNGFARFIAVAHAQIRELNFSDIF